MKFTIAALFASTIIDSLGTTLLCLLAGLALLMYILVTVGTRMDDMDRPKSDNPIADETAHDLNIEPWWNQLLPEGLQSSKDGEQG